MSPWIDYSEEKPVLRPETPDEVLRCYSCGEANGEFRQLILGEKVAVTPHFDNKEKVFGDPKSGMFCITCTRYSIDPSKMSGVIATVGKYTKRPSD